MGGPLLQMHLQVALAPDCSRTVSGFEEDVYTRSELVESSILPIVTVRTYADPYSLFGRFP